MTDAKQDAYPDYAGDVLDAPVSIPAHWVGRRLKLLFREVDERSGGSVSRLLSLTRDRGLVDSSESGQRASEASDYGKYKVCRPDDVVMNKMQAWNGIFGLCEVMGIVSPDYTVFRPIENLSLPFFTYLLRSPLYAGIFFKRCRGMGTAFLRLNSVDFGDTVAPFPPLYEQTQIARFLDYETARIDALIEKQQQLIALLKEKRQAVISHAVTKGLNPKAPLRDSGVEWLGMVPAHWAVAKLHHLSSRIGDGLHGTPNYQDGTGLYFINGNNLDAGRIIIGESAKQVPHHDFLAHQVPLSAQSVLISINGTIGKVALYCDEPVILGKSAAYINCLPALGPQFLMNFFETHHAKRYYELLSTGTTISNLSLDAIRQLTIGLPSPEEQKAIVEYAMRQREKYDSLILVASKLADTLQERRTALISAAVTGKVDVRNWAPPDSNAEQRVA